MPPKVSQSPRSRRNRLERIDIDELFDSPSNRGMLSFLERAPEEARARLEERRKVDSAAAALTSLPRASDVSVLKANSAPASSLAVREPTSKLLEQLTDESDDRGSATDEPTGGDLQSGYDLNSELSECTSIGASPTGGNVHPVGASHTGGKSPTAGDLTRAPQAGQQITTEPTNLALAARVPSPTGTNLTPVPDSPAEASLTRVRNLPSKVPQIGDSPNANNRSATPSAPRESRNISSQERAAESDSPSVGNSPPPPYPSLFQGGASQPRTATATYEPLPLTLAATAGGKLPTDVIAGTIIGRRQKIRRAVVAQDGHSSGEQLLYQALWNAARPESGSLDRRSIVAGYQGMSALCKLDKKNCKKNAKGLIDKLALEVAATYRSDERIGRTYRIFSYKEILRRREEAGMVWVVRTSGVRFVPLTDKDRGQGVIHPGGDLSKTNVPLVTAVGKLPTGFGNSPVNPRGNWPTASVGDSPRRAVGETPTLLEQDRNAHQETSSVFPPQLGPKLRALLPSFDDDAVRQLWSRCCQIAPDCAEDDIEYCFQIKAHQLLRGRKKIDNPVGIMIWSVPKTFEGTDPLYLRRRREIQRIREAEEEERQRSRATLMEMLKDPRTSLDDKGIIRRLLEDQ